MAAIPVLLVAAIQGWLLYGLHDSIDNKTWPATDAGWLLGLYSAVGFAPLALAFFAARLRARLPWILAAAIALVGGGLGAYAGRVMDSPPYDTHPFRLQFLFALYGALFVAWFIALPFAQARARRGGWASEYRDLFELSWQNALLLSEAALFTGVFWILLILWAALFRIVDIAFFAELFARREFVYPVSAIAFGYAIHLVESNEKIITVLRRHLLGLMSWLLPLVALIAVLFMLALPLTGLQPVWRTGHATPLMLCLQLLFILLLNAAYQDGQAEPRYPSWLRRVLRVAVFTLPVYAALCAYSLGLRVDQYGWTLSRVWAAIAIFAAAVYGIGYAAAALRRSPWMAGISRTNVGAALAIAAVLLLATSPLLDPRRISAYSQMAQIRSDPSRADFNYLRFELGRHGKEALEQLAKGPDAQIAELASAALLGTYRWNPAPEVPKLVLSRTELFPAGTVLDPEFVAYLQSSIRGAAWQHPPCLVRGGQEKCLLVALDLNADGLAEILAFSRNRQAVYAKLNGRWQIVGPLRGTTANWPQLERRIREGRIRAVPPAWGDVAVGETRFRLHSWP